MDNKYIPPYNGKIPREFFEKAMERFSEYKAQKEDLQLRFQENNMWYKQQYGGLINRKSGNPEPSTGFIFSAIENKYADAIDNFPVPNVLERNEDDAQTAHILSKILPVQLETSNFKEAYKKNWRRKLKHGTGAYGVFYNHKSGEICINVIDLMNLYVDMNIEDIQDSQFLFITNAVDNDILKHMYPEYSDLFSGDCDVETEDGTVRIKDRTRVIDCYYKKPYETVDGNIIKAVHMMKIADGSIIDSTEDSEDSEAGLYMHGMYPVVLDVLYPEDNCPFGFGIVDTIKNPQSYIDKLDSLIIKNALISGKQRFIIRDNGGINEKEFADYSNDIIHSAGSVDDESVRPFQANALPNFIMEHRSKKIEELKEIAGNRDFQQGGTSNGVTSGTAITILQETGEKISRSMIDNSFDAYTRIVYLVIELMREFYSDEHIYRIVDEKGDKQFASFSNEMMYRRTRNALGNVTYSEPISFDIEIVPQKQNPFSREAANSTLLSLWQAGVFSAENLDGARALLECMNFNGREKLIRYIEEMQQKNSRYPAPERKINVQGGTI